MLLSFFFGLLTVVLVLDCLFLLLLILIQLPKKEAGLGQAFGSSTTDALFGSGSGTALTKMTKYAAVIFFVLTFLLAILSVQARSKKGGGLRRGLEKVGKETPVQTTPAATAATNATAPAPAVPIKLTNLPTAVTSAVAPAAAAAAPAAPAVPTTNKPVTPQPK